MPSVDLMDPSTIKAIEKLVKESGGQYLLLYREGESGPVSTFGDESLSSSLHGSKSNEWPSQSSLLPSASFDETLDLSSSDDSVVSNYDYFDPILLASNETPTNQLFLPQNTSAVNNVATPGSPGTAESPNSPAHIAVPRRREVLVSSSLPRADPSNTRAQIRELTWIDACRLDRPEDSQLRDEQDLLRSLIVPEQINIAGNEDSSRMWVDYIKNLERVDLLNIMIKSLLFMPQLKSRAMSTAWVRITEPSKRSTHPYKGGEDSAPKWWPRGVRHIEPVHLLREERVMLHMAIMLYESSRLSLLEKAAVVAAPSEHRIVKFVLLCAARLREERVVLEDISQFEHIRSVIDRTLANPSKKSPKKSR